ncbi:hypothetical protein [Nostoc sp.]|uniref:hypothetical protein n=1 Tax=Nostoc sp. TaxID=1180 RepID=UPI002FF4DDF6
MSNLGQINRNTNNHEQNKTIWVWVFTVGSIILGCTTVLANLAKIADSTKEFCKNYYVPVMQGVCTKLEERQKTHPINSLPQASKISTPTPKSVHLPTKEPQQQDTPIYVSNPENLPKFRRWKPQQTGIATNATSDLPKFHRLQKTSEPQPALPTFRRLGDKS